MNVIKNVIGLFLLATPFLIGWGIFSILSPCTWWERFATLILGLIICVPEGFAAWYTGLAILLE